MQRFALLFFTLVFGCATRQIIPDDARTTGYDQRIDGIMRRLVTELPEESQIRGFSYVIWNHSDQPTVGQLLVVDPDTRQIYIHEVMTTLGDDLLALCLGHEIGHVVERGVPKGILLIGAVGASAGGGVVVGMASQWYWGLLTGGGALLFVAPPILFALSRDDEADQDLFGLNLMIKAGFNANRAVEENCQLDAQLETFLTERDREGRGTHPIAIERCENLREHLRQQLSK